MTDDSIWMRDTLEVDDDGHVTGSALTEAKDGHRVSAGVTSYEYDRNGETRMNHVPHITVADPSGKVVAEPHAHDADDPETAIENARQTAKHVYENLSEHVDE